MESAQWRWNLLTTGQNSDVPQQGKKKTHEFSWAWRKRVSPTPKHPWPDFKLCNNYEHVRDLLKNKCFNSRKGILPLQKLKICPNSGKATWLLIPKIFKKYHLAQKWSTEHFRAAALYLTESWELTIGVAKQITDEDREAWRAHGCQAKHWAVRKLMNFNLPNVFFKHLMTHFSCSLPLNHHHLQCPEWARFNWWADLFWRMGFQCEKDKFALCTLLWNHLFVFTEKKKKFLKNSSEPAINDIRPARYHKLKAIMKKVKNR